jgi:hypothetical protein
MAAIFFFVFFAHEQAKTPTGRSFSSQLPPRRTSTASMSFSARCPFAREREGGREGGRERNRERKRE